MLTLADEQHYVYLAVHGASHAWFRLKWLVDFCWWLSQLHEQDIVGMHRAAVRSGAGRCSAQGLLLAHRLFGFRVPLELLSEFARNPLIRFLVQLAERAIASRGGAVELAEKRVLARSILWSQLLLSDLPGYRRQAIRERLRGVGAPEGGREEGGFRVLRRSGRALHRLLRP